MSDTIGRITVPTVINSGQTFPLTTQYGSLYAWEFEQRFVRLQSAGLVTRVVRHRMGNINRAILFLRGEPKPLSASSGFWAMGRRGS